MKRRLIASVMAAMFVVASVPGQTISALAGEQVSVEETYAAGSEGGQADQTQAVAAETASPDNTSEASAAGAAAQVAGDDVSDAMTPELTASDTGVEASLIEDQDSQPSEVVPDDVLSADQSSEGEMPEDGIIEEGSDSAAGDSGLISEDGQEAVSGNMVEERAPEAETKLGEDELINLELNEQVEMTLESGDTRVFTFIPSETGAYRFHSVGATEDAGIYVSISNDLSGTDTIGYGTTDSSTGESQAEGVLKVGIKYYLRAGYYKDNGAPLTVAFQLDQENRFLATAEHQNVKVPFGQQAKLKVNVSGGTDVIYQWLDSDDNSIPNATGSEYRTTEAGNYRCKVTSEEESCYVDFRVSLDTGLEVRSSDGRLGTVSMVVAAGSTPTLAINATTTAMVDSSKFVYSWYRYDVNGGNGLLIRGETKNIYTTDPVNNNVAYSCIVEDGFGNSADIWFNIQVDNAFRATVKGRDESSADMEVKPNESITLEVAADATVKNFTYQWYQTSGQYASIEGANADTYTVENVSKRASYQCEVTDCYGNHEYVNFDVSVDNKLRATVKGSDATYADIEVDLNGNATLEVEADAVEKGFTYQWYQRYQTSGQYASIEGANADTYTVENVSKRASYQCEVTDCYGNSATVDFNVIVKHDLYVLDDENQRQTYDEKHISILKEESLTLAPNVVGASKFEWRKGDSELIPVVNESSSSVTIHGSDFSSGQEVEYVCIASDDYDNQVEIHYFVELAETLHLDSNGFYGFYQNESGRIRVTATTPDNESPVVFKWYYSSNEEGPFQLISTSDSTMPDKNRAMAVLSIENTQEADVRYYRCEAQQGEKTDSIIIEVDIVSTLNAAAEDSLIIGNEGSKVSLKVKAESTVSEPTYSWYRLDDDGNRSSILGNTSSLEVTISSGQDSYLCAVADQNGECVISFLTVGASVAAVEYKNADQKEKAAGIACGSPLLVKWPDFSDPESAIYLKFVPKTDGTYTIKSEGGADTVLKLLDADGNVIKAVDDNDDNGDLNFYLKWDLKANSTYYFSISTYNGGKAESLVSVVYDHTHTWRKLSEKPATCTEAGEKTEICDCGEKRTTSIQALGHVEEKIPAVAATCTKTGLTEGTKCSRCDVILRAQQSTPVLGHSYGAWVQVKAPTALEEGYRERTCTRCGAKDPGRQMIAKLPATMTLNATSIPLQVKKSTTKLTVSGLAAGDSVASVASSNTKIVKASWNGRVLKITAQKKTGKAKVTITLRSGLSRTVTVKVQKPKVVSRKITGVPSKLTLKKGQKYQLTPGIQPITAPDKIKYSSSNKKTAKVSSKGLITAGKKPGKATITISAGGKKFKVKVTVPKK